MRIADGSDRRAALRRRSAWLLAAVLALGISGCGIEAFLREISATPSPDTSASSATPSPDTSPSSAASSAAAGWWHPTQGERFYLQYSGALRIPEAASVVDLDGEDTSAEQVTSLTDAGQHAVCYINAGGFENWRLDKSAFPAAVIGKPLDDWAGERWLDIRQLDVLLPIMASRMDSCAAKGFEAVDPDNMDGYGSNTGFPLRKSHTIRYMTELAKLAHQRGLAIGIKNAVETLDGVTPVIDFAVNEECREYDECQLYAPLVATGKPVFHIEYSGDFDQVCADSPKGFSTVLADLELGPDTKMCS